jgi:hypothetical protein
MRDGQRWWQYAGMIAKVSGEDSVISNVRRGGYATNSGYQSYETDIVLGMDQTGKLWIIEVNLTYPSFELFKRLPDTEAYRKRRREAIKKS